MSEKSKQIEKCPFHADLDSEIKTVSGGSLKSLLGLFEHLETLGVRQARSPKPAAAKNRKSKAQQAQSKGQSFAGDSLERVRVRDLGRQVIRAAKSQVRALQTRAFEMQSLVLINNWTVAERLWWELLPDCKTPLFMLSFLEELWGMDAERMESNGGSLARHWHQFILIQAEVEILLSHRQSLVELSDAVDAQLGAWLKKFDELLEKLDEESTV